MSSKKWYLYFGAHALILMTFIGIAFFAVPTTDDYAFAYQSLNSSIIDSAKGMFAGWGGRYVQAIVCSIWYKTADSLALSYSTGLLLFIILLFGGILAFITQLLHNIYKFGVLVLVSLVILAGLVRGFPTLDESIYWNIGGVTYLLPSAVFLGMLALIMYGYRTNKDLLLQPAIMIMILFTAGINEAFVVFNVLVISALFIFMKINHKIRYCYLLSLISALLGVYLIIISKGNAARMLHYPESGKMLYSLIYGALYGTRAILQAVVDPYIWGSLLLFSVSFSFVKKKLPATATSKSSILLYSIVLLLMLYAVVAIHYYATGHRPVQRLMVVWYIIFYIGLIPLDIMLSSIIMRIYEVGNTVFERIVSKRIELNTPIFILTVLSFLLINNPPKVAYDLIYNIPSFMQEVDDFNKKVSELQQSDVKPKELIIREFKTDPFVLKAPTDANYGMDSYFGFDSVKILPKAEE